MKDKISRIASNTAHILQIIKKTKLAGMLAVVVGAGLVLGFAFSIVSSMRQNEAIRSMSELERFEAATRSFNDKYGYLPGDMPAALALQLRFVERSGAEGRGDGNGLLEGAVYRGGPPSGLIQTGENMFFWEDLYLSDFIKEPFRAAADAEPGSDISETLGEYLPDAKMRKNDRVYVYSYLNHNYLGISSVTKIEGETGVLYSHPGLSVQEAYAIDKKLDDGAPASGKVVARYLDKGLQNPSTAEKPSAVSCSDTFSGGYSLGENKGAGVNCGLSLVLADP